MAYDFLNPMLGLDLTEEQKKLMLARALLSGGAATVGAANQPGMQPYGAGMQALMGSLDQQQQFALMAQMQGLQRKNIESQMEYRKGQSEMAGKEYELSVDREERLAKGQEQGIGIQERQLSLQERRAKLEADEYARKRRMIEERQAAAEGITKDLPEGPEGQQELVKRLARFNALYGSGSVSYPSQNPLAGMFGQFGQQQQPQPTAPEPPKPTVRGAGSLSEGMQIQQTEDVAKKAAKNARQKSTEAYLFVQQELSPAYGGVGSKEQAQNLIQRTEELWEYIPEGMRPRAIQIVKRLKDEYGL